MLPLIGSVTRLEEEVEERRKKADEGWGCGEEVGRVAAVCGAGIDAGAVLGDRKSVV